MDTKERNAIGWTALHAARAYKHDSVVSLLLANGARLESSDQFVGTPLTVAAQAGSVSIVRLLLKAGANPDGSLDPYHLTPLQEACKEGTPEEISKDLLMAGADVNLGTPSPLELALQHCRRNIVNMLLQKGARADLLPTSCRTKLDLEASFSLEEAHDRSQLINAYRQGVLV